MMLGCIPVWAQSNDHSTWLLEVQHPDPSHYYGITVANGQIGIISAPQPLQVKEIVLNGAYDEYGRGRVSNLLKTFSFANVELSINGQPIDVQHVNHFEQSLDMYRAVLKSSFDVGNRAHITCTWRALRQLPYNALITVEVQARESITLSAATVIEAPDILREVHQYYEEIDRPHALLHLLFSSALSPTGKLSVAAATSFIFDEPRAQQPQVIHEMWDGNRHLMRFNKTLKAGESYSFAIAAATISSAQSNDPTNEAERLTIFEALQTPSALIAQHEEDWRKLWQSDIRIEGDDSTQRDIHSMLYHLYAFARAGSGLSLSPMGLSGLGYNGHVFWDADLWMYPVLLQLHPEIAQSLIEYRIHRLNAAMQNAYQHGYKGAMYPWESAASGAEETPVWALSGPFEHHITACVAIAVWQYFCVTHDTAWLQREGYPVLKATADFWLSRVSKAPDGYHIRNVVAADEWAENVDDDAFTNGAAIVNLQDAVKAARLLGLPPNPAWQHVADSIVILHFPDGVIKEHATYRGEQIKQADVNLLAYPLGLVRNPEQIKKDLIYYEPRIGAGPAMSYAILSLLYERLGDPQEAYALFKRGYVSNELPPFNVLAETAGGTNPYFATGAGGILQAVLNGFGGLQITDQGIVQLPTRLPPQWKSLTITGVGMEKKDFSVQNK
ncbi:MAG: glycoside hydrolase family 65 protein [Thermoflavifilum sp.]|nr:glycoside hydrolase family 65 protein [Thermoflavifilum sp.]